MLIDKEMPHKKDLMICFSVDLIQNLKKSQKVNLLQSQLNKQSKEILQLTTNNLKNHSMLATSIHNHHSIRKLDLK